jgi:cytochrome oxidase Cu insertion factor (SCO1/SenC/PrrC family)
MNPGRRMLLLLAALFLAPLAISFFMYYGHADLQPTKRVNRGELFQPARPLPPLSLTLADGNRTPADFLRHHWTVLYAGDGDCDARCRTALHDSRQVRLALDRDMVRVQRVFVASGACCDLEFLKREHPDLLVVRADAAAAGLLPLLDAAPGSLYVIDPLSNLILHYAPDAPPKGLLEDLKRLLKLSQIG